MINTTKEPIQQQDRDKISSLLLHPGWEVLLSCIRSEQAAIEADVANKAVASGTNYWNPDIGREVKELVTRAAERKIFLNVVDEFSAHDYQFFRLKLSC